MSLGSGVVCVSWVVWGRMDGVTEGGENMPKVGSDSATSVTFVLLVFFLVAASVSASHNLTEQLPPPPRGGSRGSSSVVMGRQGVLRIHLGGSGRLVYNASCVSIGRLGRGTGRFVTGPCSSRGLPRGREGGVPLLNSYVVARGRMVSIRGSIKADCRTCVSIRGRLITTCGRLHGRLNGTGFKGLCGRYGRSRRGTVHRCCPRGVSRTRPGGCKNGW